MGSQSSPLRVLIVGSGSAGLLFGQGLKQAGIACTIFEQDTSLYQRPRDWNFGIYWAQNGLEMCLPDHLKPSVKTVQTNPNYVTDENTTMPVHNGETGELLKPLPAPFGWRVKRKMWLEMLQKDINIKWGKKVTKIQEAENSVIITFEDGTKVTGNLLIGCEGAHSLTREYLLGPEEAALFPAPVVASITITKISAQASIDLRKLNTNHCITFHPNGTFTWMGVHDVTSKNPADWTWMLIQSWRADEPTGLKTDDEIRTAMYERGKTFGYPFNETFIWTTKPWIGSGLVTIAGDTAHPMTFHRGQGVNNAITDAADFLVHLKAMKEHTHKELMAAVKKCEIALVPRGVDAVMASYKNTLAVHDWNSVMSSPLFTKSLAKYKMKEDASAPAEAMKDLNLKDEVNKTKWVPHTIEPVRIEKVVSVVHVVEEHSPPVAAFAEVHA